MSTLDAIIEDCSGRRRAAPARAQVQGHPQGDAAPARARLRGPRATPRSDRPMPGAAQPPAAPRPRPPGRHRLPLDPARGPGHRALGGRVLRQEPRLLRSREHREARDRGRLQRGGLDPRRARRGGAQVRAQDPLHRQAQPQRVPDLPEQVRPDHVRPRRAGARTWARRRWAPRSTSARPSRRARSWR